MKRMNENAKMKKEKKNADKLQRNEKQIDW